MEDKKETRTNFYTTVKNFVSDPFGTKQREIERARQQQEQEEELKAYAEKRAEEMENYYDHLVTSYQADARKKQKQERDQRFKNSWTPDSPSNAERREAPLVELPAGLQAKISERAARESLLDRWNQQRGLERERDIEME